MPLHLGRRGPRVGRVHSSYRCRAFSYSPGVEPLLPLPTFRGIVLTPSFARRRPRRSHLGLLHMHILLESERERERSSRQVADGGSCSHEPTKCHTGQLHAGLDSVGSDFRHKNAHGCSFSGSLRANTTIPPQVSKFLDQNQNIELRIANCELAKWRLPSEPPSSPPSASSQPAS